MKSVSSIHSVRRQSPVVMLGRHRAGVETGSRGDTIVMRAYGEFDAANCDHLIDAIRRVAGSSSSVILDLSDIDFLGLSVFCAVSELNRVHRDAGLLLIGVPSTAVRRLTHLLPHHGLLLEASVAKAVEQIAQVGLARHRLPPGTAPRPVPRDSSRSGSAFSRASAG